MKQPKPVLKAGIIYSGDNGRLICVHCAGMSAKYTGRDLSGHRVTPLNQADADHWMQVMNEHLKCESGCTVHKTTQGITFNLEQCAKMFGREYAESFAAKLDTKQLCASS